MTTMPRITGGVDTHLDNHAVAALDSIGGPLGVESFPAEAAGCRAALDLLESFGEIDRVGVEGTGSYGAGLSRFLLEHRVEVVEVDRPKRQLRRRQGQSDPIDAVAAARAERSGVDTDTAGPILVAAGDNPDGLRSEATFARLCGVSPLDVSSGKQERHRLNRSGDRQVTEGVRCALGDLQINRCEPSGALGSRTRTAPSVRPGGEVREATRTVHPGLLRV